MLDRLRILSLFPKSFNKFNEMLDPLFEQLLYRVNHGHFVPIYFLIGPVLFERKIAFLSFPYKSLIGNIYSNPWRPYFLTDEKGTTLEECLPNKLRIGPVVF